MPPCGGHAHPYGLNKLAAPKPENVPIQMLGRIISRQPAFRPTSLPTRVDEIQSSIGHRQETELAGARVLTKIGQSTRNNGNWRLKIGNRLETAASRDLKKSGHWRNLPVSVRARSVVDSKIAAAGACALTPSPAHRSRRSRPAAASCRSGCRWPPSLE